jgi:microsomal dipeptidase-like Zn-dependent dipeptidase
MNNEYESIRSMKEVPDKMRKLRRQYLRYQQAEIVYSISHKKLLEMAGNAGAIYRIDGTVLINRDIFDEYLEQFHEPATSDWKGRVTNER